MTLDEFYETLAQVPCNWALHISGTRGAGSVLRTKPKYVCPVCAVANQILGTDYEIAHHIAAKRVGLDPLDAEIIANAADGTINGKVEDYANRVREARGRLLQITNPERP